MFEAGAKHRPKVKEVSMWIAATTDAQPVKHRPKIKEIGTEMTVQGP